MHKLERIDTTYPTTHARCTRYRVETRYIDRKIHVMYYVHVRYAECAVVA